MKEKRHEGRLARRPVTIIGADASVAGGRLEVEHDLRLDGAIEADVQVGGRLIVSQNASIVGSVRANDLLLEGRVSGNVRVEDVIQVRAGALLEGRIRASRLIVEEGASGVVDVETVTEDAEQRRELVASRAPLAKEALRVTEEARARAGRSRFMEPPRVPGETEAEAGSQTERASHPVYEDASATLVWSDDVAETGVVAGTAGGRGIPEVELTASARGIVSPPLKRPTSEEIEISVDRTERPADSDRSRPGTDELLEAEEMSEIVEGLEDAAKGTKDQTPKPERSATPSPVVPAEDSESESFDRFW